MVVAPGRAFAQGFADMVQSHASKNVGPGFVTCGQARCRELR